MKQPIFKLAILPFLIFLFNQCEKEEIQQEITGEKRGEIKLTDAELAIIPYQVNDSIIFKDSLGNSQTFKVDSRQINLSRYYRNGGTDTKTDYYDIERLYVLLSNDNGTSFVFEMYAPLPSYVSDLNLGKNYLMIWTNAFGVANNHYSFSNYIDPTNFYYSIQGASIPYHASFTIINNTYNSVYELTETSSSRKIYYNQENGIVGFKAENDVNWYLDN
jgi:hypothetical protein